MKKFKIKVAYDGTNYQGWQSQPHSLTLADTLEKRFFKIFGKKISIIGASRTDAGVHSLGQIAAFKTDLDIGAQKIHTIWNKGLPLDIQIRALDEVSLDFHPMKDVAQKTYLYHLFLARPLPFVARYGWQYEMIHKVDLVKFKSCLEPFVGEHDFRSFCKLETDQSTIKKIDAIELRKFPHFGILQVKICGPSFLRFQIRRMIGAALDVARRENLSKDYILEMLKNPCGEQELVKADANGLCLYRINYKNFPKSLFL